MILKNAKLDGDKKLLLEFDENVVAEIEDPEFTILFNLFKTLIVLEDTKSRYCGPVQDWKPGNNPLSINQNGI